MGSLPDERHTDTELERPELLSSERLAAIVAECLRRWDAYPTIPGSLRWSRNGLLALHQLEATIERREKGARRVHADWRKAERELRDVRATIERQRPVIEAARWAVEASDLARLNYDVPEPAGTDFREQADEAWSDLRKKLAALSEGDSK